LLASVAAVPTPAAAGQVLISPGFGESPPGLYVQSSLGVALGAISVLTVGSTGFTFNSALLNLSLADSSYVAGAIPGYDSLSVVAVNGQALLPAFDGTGMPPVFLGTFQRFDPYGVVTVLPGETDIPGFGSAFGATLYDVALNPIVASSISLHPCDLPNCGPLLEIDVAPEPESLSLFGSLAVFAVAYGALGGKSRRRKASVGAPT
jgi:hypothetical protein